ncbi:TPA: hypothetical protein ACGOWO_002122, partial [Streptococcus suis]
VKGATAREDHFFMSMKKRKRIETLTGLFSLCPRNWKGALCGDFFLRSRNAKSAITEWTIFS